MKKKWLLAGLIVVGLGAIALYRGHDAARPRVIGSSKHVPTPSGGAVDTFQADELKRKTAPRSSKKLPLEQQDFREIRRLADQGNPVAQRVLSDRYADCSSYSLSPARYKETVEGIAKMGGVPKATVEHIKASADRLCADVDDGQPIPHEAVDLWLEQSAKNGDLIAKVKLAAKAPEELKPAEADQLISDVVASGDPNALLELSMLVGQINDVGDDSKYQRYIGGASSDESAWAIAACRRGASCGADSRIMKLICINTMHCDYSSYEQFLLAEVVPKGGMKRIDAVAKALDQNFVN